MIVLFDKKHPEFLELQRVWQCCAVSHSHYAIASWKAEAVVDNKQRIIATDGHRLAIYTREPTGEWPVGAHPFEIWPILPGYYKTIKATKTMSMFEYSPDLGEQRWPRIEDVIPSLDTCVTLECPPAGTYTNNTASDMGYSSMLYDLWTRGCPMFNIELASPLRGINRKSIICRYTGANKPIRFDCNVCDGTLLYILMPIGFAD